MRGQRCNHKTICNDIEVRASEVLRILIGVHILFNSDNNYICLLLKKNDNWINVTIQHRRPPQRRYLDSLLSKSPSEMNQQVTLYLH